MVRRSPRPWFQVSFRTCTQKGWKGTELGNSAGGVGSPSEMRRTLQHPSFAISPLLAVEFPRSVCCCVVFNPVSPFSSLNRSFLWYRAEVTDLDALERPGKFVNDPAYQAKEGPYRKERHTKPLRAGQRHHRGRRPGSAGQAVGMHRSRAQGCGSSHLEIQYFLTLKC